MKHIPFSEEFSQFFACNESILHVMIQHVKSTVPLSLETTNKQEVVNFHTQMLQHTYKRMRSV